MKNWILAFALLGVGSVWGCNRSSPTELPFNSSKYEVSATIQNADGTATILRCQSTLDGQPLSPAQSFSAPVTQATLTGAVESLSSGRHELSIVILDQTASPSPYVLSDVEIRLVTVVSGNIFIPWYSHSGARIPGTLESGASITTSFTY